MTTDAFSTAHLTGLTTALATRYRLERELGVGGMATVWLAEDLRHERRVAIKVLHPELSAVLGPERFLAEIRTTANLQHPHILPLFDSGSAEGLLYYVMPYVEGETLRVRLERERQLPVTDAVRLARQIADALQYAHERGVVHRDVKPENILLQGGHGSAQHALVADFGIALAVQHAGGARMTQTGLSLGTPHYMAPEQAMGERSVDARADVYALGAVTYEMLAGEPPFTGPTAQAILARVLTSAPAPITATRPSVPAHVAAAIATALAKLPADRWESAAAFATALESPAAQVEPARSVPTVRRTSGRWRRSSAALAGTALAATAALAAWGWLRPARTAAGTQVTRVALALPAGQALRPHFMGFAVGLSPDGRRLAYVGVGPTVGTTQLWIRPLDALDATPVPGTQGAAGLQWSPDGRTLLVLHMVSQTTTAVSADGSGHAVPIPDLWDASWGEDGRVWGVQGGRALVRLPVGGVPDTLYRADTTYVLSHAVPLPGGDAALMVRVPRATTAVASSEIIAVTFATGRMTPVTQGVYARVLASGELLYVAADGNAFVAPFDARAHRLTGAATPIAQVAMGSNSGRSYPELSVSHEGTMVYLSGTLQRERVLWLDANGRRGRPLDIEGDIWGLALSPDGARLAFALRDDARSTGAAARGSGSVWVQELASGARTRITDSLFSPRPSWSPDGRSLLYARIGGPWNQALVERRADASAPEHPVLVQARFGHSIGDGRWLSDHRRLVVRTYAEGGAQANIYWTEPGADDVAHPFATTAADEAAPAPSPDGTLLASLSNETGARELYVQRFPSGERIVVSQGGSTPARWSRDGHSLYYWDQRGRLVIASISSRPALAVTARREVRAEAVPNQGRSDQQFDVAADGRVVLAEDVPGALDLVLVRNWPAAFGRRH